MANYGAEDVAYTVDEDGGLSFTELITNNPEGFSYSLAKGVYTFTSATINDNPLNLLGYTDRQIGSLEVWNITSDTWDFPVNANMTVEETFTFNNIYADINTFVEEQVLSFITGAILVSEYDAFINQLILMDIQTCIEIKQAALDSYNNK